MNEKLKEELIMMKNEDVLTRERLFESVELKKEEYDTAITEIRRNNNARIKEIIKQLMDIM